MKHTDKILQEALMKNNILAEEEIQKYITAAQTAKETLQDYLVKKGVVTEKQVLIAFSQYCHLDTIDLKSIKVDAALIERVPVKFAWYYKFMPVKLEGNSLTIASAYPMDIRVQDEIRRHLGMAVTVVLTESCKLTEMLKQTYGLASDTIDKIMTKTPDEKNRGIVMIRLTKNCEYTW